MTTRVVLLARSLDVGGAETQLVSLATALPALGFSVSVVTFYGGGALEEQLRAAGVSVHHIEKRGRWDVVRFGMRLASVLRGLRPQVIHSYLGPPNILAAALRPRCSRLVWGMRASDMNLRHYDWTWRVVARAERALSGFPDRIIANSYAGRDHAIAGGFPAASIDVIANGIDTDHFRPDLAAGQLVRKEWRISGPLIGLVARLDPMKDHTTFLRAARLLSDQRPDVRFVCVGRGEPEQARHLREQAGALGVSRQVIWAGERRDIPSVLNAIDVATLCSAFGEGFPNAVGEAMACGVPCVVTDVGDSKIVVGEDGVVVPRGDPAALADAWHGVLSMRPEERMARATSSRNRVLERFSKEAMVMRTAALYRGLAAAA